MLAQVLRGNIYQDSEIRGEGRVPSSVKESGGGENCGSTRRNGGFLGIGRTKLARGCSRLNPFRFATDRLELTFLNDVLLQRVPLPSRDVKYPKEFLLSKKQYFMVINIRKERTLEFVRCDIFINQTFWLNHKILEIYIIVFRYNELKLST